MKWRRGRGSISPSQSLASDRIEIPSYFLQILDGSHDELVRVTGVHP